MKQYTIAVIVGSLRQDSLNRSLATALADLAPKHFRLQHVNIGTLPLYNEDDDDKVMPEVVALKQEIERADGLLFVTPEYNRSIPGVLKNALDHGSRPYGSNSWAGKPAGVLGVSIGIIGTALAQQHLRSILSCLDVPTLGQPEVYLQAQTVFTSPGVLSATSKEFLQQWMDTYAAWVSKHA